MEKWDEFLSHHSEGLYQRMLFQAIAALSTREGFSHLTPEEVWMKVQKLAA